MAFGVSLSVIDSTIANVALPTISRALGISSADSIWIVNAYQLAIAMVSLLSLSALGDVVGYRKVLHRRSGALHRRLGGLRPLAVARNTRRRPHLPGLRRRLP